MADGAIGLCPVSFRGCYGCPAPRPVRPAAHNSQLHAMVAPSLDAVRHGRNVLVLVLDIRRLIRARVVCIAIAFAKVSSVQYSSTTTDRHGTASLCVACKGGKSSVKQWPKMSLRLRLVCACWLAAAQPGYGYPVQPCTTVQPPKLPRTGVQSKASRWYKAGSQLTRTCSFSTKSWRSEAMS